MSYVHRVLEPGETIRYATTLHWLVYLPALLLLGAAAVAALLSRQVEAAGRPILLIAAALLAVLALAAWLPAALRRIGTELVVTDRRVICKSGLLARHTIEMNRTKVESVDVDQTLLGRLLGYGTITVHGTGGTLEPIRGVARPLKFRSNITAA